MRALKRRISDAVYHQLLADTDPLNRTGPGGQPGTTLTSSVAGQTLNTGTSEQPLPNPNTNATPTRRTVSIDAPANTHLTQTGFAPARLRDEPRGCCLLPIRVSYRKFRASCFELQRYGGVEARSGTVGQRQGPFSDRGLRLIPNHGSRRSGVVCGTACFCGLRAA